MMARAGGVWLVAVLLATAGCDTPSPSTPTPTPTPTQATTAQTPTGEPSASTPARPAGADVVTLAKTGGLVGVNVVIKVQPDGRWRVDDGGRTVRSGLLGAAQLARLRDLLADPRLAGEAAGSMSRPPRCADAFMYLLVVDYQLVNYEDCANLDRPPVVTTAVIQLLEAATSG